MIKPIFQVSEFNELIDFHLKRLDRITVEGEISQIKTSQNKWLWITLKDETAQLTVFGLVFKLPIVSQLQVGDLVQVKGGARLHQRTGKFSLFAEKIVPAGTGEIQVVLERLKERLRSEGLFDPIHKRNLPTRPEHLTILTATDSQALQDVIKVARSRWAGIHLLHIPVVVQGTQAVESIITGLLQAQKLETDLILLTRGGGSIEDLMTFNDERLVRAVFSSTKVIVCAVGHEGDTTLAELAADLRASTPSNAAELIVPEKKQLQHQLDTYWLKAVQMAQRQVSHQHSQLADKLRRFQVALVRQQNLSKQKSQLLSYTVTNLSRQLESDREKYQQLQRQLLIAINYRLQQTKTELDQLTARLSLLDIQSTLDRGFSITYTDNGVIVRDPSQLSPSSYIQTRLASGIITSQVSQGSDESAKKT